MNPRSLALIALFIAAIIYGITFTIAKEVMNTHIHPFGFYFHQSWRCNDNFSGFLVYLSRKRNLLRKLILKK